MQENKPYVFVYINYRDYLKELVAWYKQNRPQFSYRFFSREAGFKSPNFLKLVIDAERNLSSESIDKFSAALKLNKEESAFFRALVNLNQATTAADKKYYSEEILKFKKVIKLYPLKRAQYDYYSKWYNITIREMIPARGFKNDPKWIASKLIPPITSTEVEKGINTLLELEIAKVDNKGNLIQAESTITTGDQVSSSAVVQYHQTMIKMAAESIERFRGNEREISSTTVALSSEKFLQIQQMIRDFRKQVLAVAEGDGAREKIYQLNFQLYPLTEIIDDGEK